MIESVLLVSLVFVVTMVILFLTMSGIIFSCKQYEKFKSKMTVYDLCNDMDKLDLERGRKVRWEEESKLFAEDAIVFKPKATAKPPLKVINGSKKRTLRAKKNTKKLVKKRNG